MGRVPFVVKIPTESCRWTSRAAMPKGILACRRWGAPRHHRSLIPRGPAPRQGCQRGSPKKAHERGESLPRQRSAPTDTIVNSRF